MNFCFFFIQGVSACMHHLPTTENRRLKGSCTQRYTQLLRKPFTKVALFWLSPCVHAFAKHISLRSGQLWQLIPERPVSKINFQAFTHISYLLESQVVNRLDSEKACVNIGTLHYTDIQTSAMIQIYLQCAWDHLCCNGRDVEIAHVRHTVCIFHIFFSCLLCRGFQKAVGTYLHAYMMQQRIKNFASISRQKGWQDFGFKGAMSLLYLCANRTLLWRANIMQNNISCQT